MNLSVSVNDLLGINCENVNELEDNDLHIAEITLELKSKLKFM